MVLGDPAAPTGTGTADRSHGIEGSQREGQPDPRYEAQMVGESTYFSTPDVAYDPQKIRHRPEPAVSPRATITPAPYRAN